MRKLSRPALAHVLLLAAVMVWGATFALVKSALADSTPLLFNLMRMALATVVLVIINFRELRRLTRRDLLAGAGCGFFLAVGYQFQTLGLARTTAVKSAFITGLIVVFVPAFTLLPGLRPPGTARPHWQTGAGAALAFTGLFLMTTAPGTPPAALFTSMGPGDLLTLVCAVAFAAHLLTMSHVARDMAAGLLATLQIGFATAFMLFTLPFEHPHAHATPRLLIALAICSLFATAAAFTIQSFAQQVLPPTHTALLCTLEPVFGAVTSLLILHEALGHRSLAGAALILAAVATVELTSPASVTPAPA